MCDHYEVDIVAAIKAILEAENKDLEEKARGQKSPIIESLLVKGIFDPGF